MKVAQCVVSLLLVFFGLCLSTAVGECDASVLGYDCKKVLAEYFHLHWSLRGESLHIALEGFGAEWIGMSFPSVPGLMAPAEAVIGWVDINGATVRAYSITTQTVFPEDEDFSIILSGVSGEQSPERTVIAFTRSLSQGRVRIRPEADTDINYAVGDADALRQHRRRNSTTVRFAADPKERRTAIFIPPLLNEDQPAMAPAPMMEFPSNISPSEEPSIASPPSTEEPVAESSIVAEEYDFDVLGDFGDP